MFKLLPPSPHGSPRSFNSCHSRSSDNRGETDGPTIQFVNVKLKPGQAAGNLQLQPFRTECADEMIGDNTHERRGCIKGQGRHTYFECGSEVMCLRYTPDGQFVVAGCADGIIRLINVFTGDCAYSLNDDSNSTNKMPVTSLSFPHPDGSNKPEHSHYLTATYANGMIKQWHYTSPGGSSALMTIDENRQTLAGTYNPNIHHHYLTAGADPILYLYDMNTRQRIMTFKASASFTQMDGHHARVFAMQYHPGQPHVFVSGGWDDTLQFWDDRQEHATRRLFGPHICGDGVDIDPTHNHILTSSWRKDHALQIWDFNSGNLIKTVPRDPFHDCLLYCGQWLGTDYILCGGCDTNIVRIIDRGTLNTVGQLSELPAAVYCVDSFDTHIVAGTGTQVWRVKNMKK